MVTSAWHDWEWWHTYEQTHDDYLVGLVKSLKGHQREMSALSENNKCMNRISMKKCALDLRQQTP